MLDTSTRQVEVMRTIGSGRDLRALVDRFGVRVYDELHPLIDDQLVAVRFPSDPQQAADTHCPLGIPWPRLYYTLTERGRLELLSAPTE